MIFLNYGGGKVSIENIWNFNFLEIKGDDKIANLLKSGFGLLQMSSTLDPLAELRLLIGRKDIRAALIFLNGLTEHRFTALYAFNKETLRNLYFFDSENPFIESTSDIPVMASYCVFVRESKKEFTITDALNDDRLGTHPKRKQVQSYCGVPLLDEYGNMFGSICHFDFKSIPINDMNVELMEKVGPLIYTAYSTLDQNR